MKNAFVMFNHIVLPHFGIHSFNMARVIAFCPKQLEKTAGIIFFRGGWRRAISILPGEQTVFIERLNNAFSLLLHL